MKNESPLSLLFSRIFNGIQQNQIKPEVYIKKNIFQVTSSKLIIRLKWIHLKAWGYII